ncbi:acyltransferase family protein [Pseudomonas lundensis]|uniref:acyltransferase family protein n=1 Tax=Pseudomonas lundensis TaxID=86185 RepID=UPI0035255951
MNTEFTLETTIISGLILALFLTFSTLLKNRIEIAEIKHNYKFINGLRGLAAVFVVINHAPFILTNMGITNNNFSSWGWIYANLGAFGVQIFFCITGFLFFDKLMKTPNMEWEKFFRGRILRIAPLYYFSSLIVFLIACIYSNFEILNKDTLITTASMLTFNFLDGQSKIGNIALTPLNAVTWTLVHEWRFYAALPLIALTYKSKYNKLALSIALILTAIDLKFSPIVCWSYFLTGIIAAILYKKYHYSKKTGWALSIIAICIFIYTCGTKEPQGYGALRFALSSIFFLCITLSNPAVLHAQCLNRLSDISYSIYLMHLPVLYLTFKLASLFVDLSLASKTTFWTINLLAIPMITIVSTLTYTHIERRFMNKTQRESITNSSLTTNR